jgi:hypothetical protein
MGELQQCGTTRWAQREAEVLEALVVSWRAENPGIDGEIVFQAGQRPRVQRVSPMTQNRAALPKPPAYARDLPDREMGLSDDALQFLEREENLYEFRKRQMRNLLEQPEGLKRREPLKAPTEPPREETISFLFAQLREMGVGCERCRFENPQDINTWKCEIQLNMTEPGFCHEWEAGE